MRLLLLKEALLCSNGLCPIVKAKLKAKVDSLDDTDRGDGGFGSTGLK